MGISWDKALPSLAALKECNRVLKHGAFGFFLSSPRQDVLARMLVKLEDAGFETNFSFISWIYNTGFPHGANMAKLVDKRLGAEPEVIGVKPRNGSAYMKEQDHYQMDNGKAIDGRDSELIRKRVESMKADGVAITAPVTPEAKALAGSYAGLQLKPALEVIICVMKPLSEATYLDQALKNKKGITWLDNCKIPVASDDSLYAKNPHTERGCNREYSDIYGEYGPSSYTPQDSRFPANVLVSDNALDNGIITKSPTGYVNRKPKNGVTFNTETCGFDNTKNHDSGYGDSGGFSRYFDLDAWFKSKLPEQVQKTYPCLLVAKPSQSEKNRYCDNTHPTVKPIKLMSYLITMGSREGDVVLDPYCGSGTTLEAARLLNRNFIGCELDESYRPIIEARSQIHNFAEVEVNDVIVRVEIEDKTVTVDYWL